MAKKVEKTNKLNNVDCSKCNLYNGILTKPQGNLFSDIYVISTRATDSSGIPLMGEAGYIFRETLKEFNLDIKRFYIDNICLCYDDKKITKKEYNSCINHIHENIKSVNPKLIVLLGAIPDKLIIQKYHEKNKSHRGFITKQDGYFYLVTGNPEDCIHSKTNLKAFKEDIFKIKRFLDNCNEDNFEYLYCDSLENIQKARELSKSFKIIVPDIETNNTVDFNNKDLKILSIAFAYGENKVIGVPLEHSQNKYFKECLNLTKDILVNKEIRKVGHNIKFDYQMLKKHFNIETENIIADTMIMMHLLDENKHEYALKKLSWELLPYGGYELNYPDYSKLELSELLHYNCTDTNINRKVFNILYPKIKKEGLSFLNFNIVTPMGITLGDVELNGIKIDIEFIKKLQKVYYSNLNKVLEELNNFPDMPEGTNFNSSKELRELLFNRWNLPIIKSTPGGEPSTDESVLIELSERHKFPKLLITHRKLTKFISTYIDRILDKSIDGFFYANYSVIGTVTGRLSGSLQNIPKKNKDIRKIFTSRFLNGKIISMDFSQMEMRMFANVTGDTKLKDFYKNDIDMHKWAATQVWGISEEEVTDELRTKVKAFDFGLFYGLGLQSMQKSLQISYNEAKIIKDKILSPFKGVAAWKKKTRKQIETENYVTNMFGRKRRFPMLGKVLDDNTKEFYIREGINFPIQSAHDLVMYGFARCNNFIKMKKLKTKIIMENHDEIVFDCPEDEIEIIKSNGKRILEDLPFDFLKIPLIVEVKIGDNWGEVK